jgi:hypothetical protein
MSIRTNVIAFALVGAASFGIWKVGSSMLSAETQATENLLNQVWVERLPVDDRDIVQHFVLIDHRQGKVGAFSRSSQWRASIEVIRWELNGSKLDMYFPQSRLRAYTTVKTWECEGEAPAPFELCMSMTDGKGGSRTLYSRKDWELKAGDVAGSLEDIIDDEPTLAGLLGTIDESSAEAADAIDLDDARHWSVRDSL